MGSPFVQLLSADDDKESSSSEDDNEDRRRLNDDLMGKVASVQTGTERTSWYLALVSHNLHSPSYTRCFFLCSLSLSLLLSQYVWYN